MLFVIPALAVPIPDAAAAAVAAVNVRIPAAFDPGASDVRRRPSTVEADLVALAAQLQATGCTPDATDASGWIAGEWSTRSHTFAGADDHGDAVTGEIDTEEGALRGTLGADPLGTTFARYARRRFAGESAGNTSVLAGTFVRIQGSRGAFVGLTATCSADVSGYDALGGWLGPEARVWSTLPVAPHPSSGADEDPALVRLADGTYRLVWYSDRGGDNDLWWSSSEDGLVWSPAEVLVDTPDNDHYPALLEGTDGTLHLAWQRIVGTSFPNVFYQRSTDGGATWSAEVAITSDPASLDWAPSLYELPTGLHLLFGTDRFGQRDLAVTRSTDAGISWGVPTRITDDPRADDFGQVAVIGGQAWLVWNRWTPTGFPVFPENTPAVLYASSADGVTFGPATELIAGPSTNVFPTVFGLDEPHVAWTTDVFDPFGDIVQAGSSGVSFFTTDIAPDYSPRLAPTDVEGRWLMAFTSDRTGDLDVHVSTVGVP
ncbi:MAG: exo-alpha-sialidase [Alphaproteobacteria bacterium]|nr:exo-alpha-sialidase [Alphaproteobacteria bacterium]